jgi:hypothetical protein
MSPNSWEALNPMSNNLPPVHAGRVSNSRPVALIPFVGLRLSLDQNPQALVSATIFGVRIHERGLTHVAKLVGSAELNVQHLQDTFMCYTFLGINSLVKYGIFIIKS